jgi:UPF0176 protein
MVEVAILNFYSFVNIQEPEMLIPKILLIGRKKSIKGTILLAKEGFNGGVSGSKKDLDLLVDSLKSITNAEDINIKVNYAKNHPFRKLKVKIKKEIVTMGVENLDVNGLKGEYVEPKDWDNFLNKKDVILIDTRNDYEIEAGTFSGAIDPKTDTFRQFPEWVSKNEDILKNRVIAMCCTGGVRCEKSTAYLKSLGYKEVYHLKGGILQYLEDTKNVNNKWVGECFVFDDRRAVDKELSPVENY